MNIDSMGFRPVNEKTTDPGTNPKLTISAKNQVLSYGVKNI